MQWNSATGHATVVSSPSGCVFVVGDIKWTGLNPSGCTISDLVRGKDAEGYTVGYVIVTALDARAHAKQLIIESEFADTYAR